MRWLLVLALCAHQADGYVARAPPRAWLCHRRTTIIETNALPVGFLSGGTAAAWTTEALASLATYKPHRIVHNSIGVCQALTVLPLVSAVVNSLAAAISSDGTASSSTVKRLSLGLSAASIWAAVGVVCAPALTAANVRTVDPVRYSAPLLAATTFVHASVAALCLKTWHAAADRPFTRSLLGGLASSALTLAPFARSEGPRPARKEVLRRSEYAALSVSFGIFAALAIFAPFPLATVPSLLGKRMARAFGAWSLLTSVVLFELSRGSGTELPGSDAQKSPDEIIDAAETHRSIVARLEGGVRQMSFAHLLIAVVRPILEHGKGVYPAAMSCKPAVAASLLIYAWALSVASCRNSVVRS